MYNFIFPSEYADGLVRDRNISQALSTDADFAETGLDVLLQATAR